MSLNRDSGELRAHRELEQLTAKRLEGFRPLRSRSPRESSKLRSSRREPGSTSCPREEAARVVGGAGGFKVSYTSPPPSHATHFAAEANRRLGSHLRCHLLTSVEIPSIDPEQARRLRSWESWCRRRDWRLWSRSSGLLWLDVNLRRWRCRVSRPESLGGWFPATLTC